MQLGVDVTCIHASFGGRGSSGFGDMATFQKRPNFPFDPCPWSSKNSIDRNQLKKFMQVGIDVECMHTDFGWRGLSGFGDKISLWSIKVEKLNRSESAQKIHATRGQCHVHSRQFWWAWLLRFRRYGYLSKTAKFPFRPMDYSPWSSKNPIDRNRLKKFMQVGIDVECVHTNFGGRGLSGFGDKISLWSIKVEKFNRSESAQKIHVSRSQCHVHVYQFWWAWSLRFRRYGYLSKTAKFPFRGMDYSPWSLKNLIDRNRLQKFMQVGIDVKCMHTSFGGRGLSGFRDMATFQKWPNFPFGAWTMSMVIKKFNRSESAQKIHASRGQCHVHSRQFWWAWLLRFWRYGYLSKTAKFPFRGMDYSPWSSKNLIDRNQLKNLCK